MTNFIDTHSTLSSSHAELQALKQELIEQQRNMEDRLWLEANLSRFDELIRLNYDKDIPTFADIVLEYFAGLTNATHEAFFVVDAERELVEAVGGYGCTVETMEKTYFQFGEGIVGQAVKSQKLISLDQIPMRIATSVYHTGMAYLVVSPFIFNQIVYGAIELITLEKLPNRYIELIKRCSQSLAVSLQSIITNQKTRLLLEESIQKTEELQAQSEELRQNMEELHAIQDELNRKDAEMTGWIQAVNETLAVVEFNMNGRITNVNQKFAKLLEYDAEDLIGRNHHIFLTKEYANSPEYQEFWQSLQQGQTQFNAEFHRVTRTGQDVWLTATYTPVKDANGVPFKVLKLAMDVTDRKKMTVDIANQMVSINQSFAVIEFDLDSTIKDANDNFLAAIGYSLEEIVGKKHKIFVTAQHAQSAEYKQLWDNLRKGEFQRGEFERITKKGSSIWISASYNPIKDAAGKPYKVVKYLMDITHLKAALTTK
jgi:PAS domain S-box-containing protein